MIAYLRLSSEYCTQGDSSVAKKKKKKVSSKGLWSSPSEFYWQNIWIRQFLGDLILGLSQYTTLTKRLPNSYIIIYSNTMKGSKASKSPFEQFEKGLETYCDVLYWVFICVQECGWTFPNSGITSARQMYLQRVAVAGAIKKKKKYIISFSHSETQTDHFLYSEFWGQVVL